MTEEELTDYAHTLAYARPGRSLEASRARARFRIERVWDEGARYIGLRVGVDARDFLASHRRPGQYTTFKVGAMKPRFLAIASAPDDAPRWEFLIDRGSGLGQYLLGESRLRVGRQILLSPAEGAGYPARGWADKLAGRTALLFSTGAGIASIRPVMNYWGDNPAQAPSDLALYYGERDVRHFAYAQEIASWRAAGARVYRAVENLGEDGAAQMPTDWMSPGHRYVQHAFETDAPTLKKASVFVSGAPVMMEIVIKKMLRLGVLPQHIHVNI